MATSDEDIEVLADSEWEAWAGRPEDSDLVPTAEEYGRYYAVLFRLCVAIMHKSKSELVEVAANMWAEPSDDPDYENALDGMMEQIAAAKNFADGMHHLAMAAEARAIAALAVVSLRDDAA